MKRLVFFFLCFIFSSQLFAQHEHHEASIQHSSPIVIKKQKVQRPSPLIMEPISVLHRNNRTVNLVISYKWVHFAGVWRRAIAVNNQIPAPTLHFKEGDHVTINVYNHLDKPTAIHWHGIIVPWQMDGVAGITQKGIPPDSVFHYQFTLMQGGTYWYHAHEGLQEQQGLYGAFIIDPKRAPHFKYTKDYVVVLSDWSNTHPDQILANLKKEGDYYSPRFPLQPSLAKFIHDYRRASNEERKKLIDDYKMMQHMRMGIYDLSDVAFDAFLLNGKTNFQPWNRPVQVGDVVRLRFIGAAGSTIFHVKIPESTMQMVHVQGNDVKPYSIQDFTVAPGETYDVLVKIQKNHPYIIYAESMDTLGAAKGALTTAPHQMVNYQVTPFPEPKPVTREMMSFMMGNMKKGNLPSGMLNHKTQDHQNHDGMAMHQMTHTMQMSSHTMESMSHEMPMSHIAENHPTHQTEAHSMKMDHSSMSMPMHHSMEMPVEPSRAGDVFSPPNPAYATSIGTKYENMIAAVQTNDPDKPVYRVIKMELFGYMDRFIWFINGEPEYKAHPISLEPGKRYRLIFTNNSMMHHPMHIHGHWFILRKGNDAFDPLLHTIDVPPGATMTADVDTDASGQWIFHCHLLYHMVAGMSRVLQYSTLIAITQDEVKPQHIIRNTTYNNRPIVRVDEAQPIDPSLVKHPMAHAPGLWLANFLDIGEDPFNNVQELTFKGLYGSDYNKLELLSEDAELFKGEVENADIDIFYWRLISQFWAIKGGVNYFYRPANIPYWQPGIGIEGLMPYFIDTDIRTYYHAGSVKFDVELSRDTQITNNFLIRLGIRSIFATKTVTDAQIGSGLDQMRYILRPYYRLKPGLTVFAEYEHDTDYGDFRTLQQEINEPVSENTLTFGLSMLF